MILRVLLILTLALSACGRLGNAAGNADTDRKMPFRAKLSAGEDRRDISVAVTHRGYGLAQLRESVRLEATKYCLLNFGGSDTRWRLDPTGRSWAYRQKGDELIFDARCTAR